MTRAALFAVAVVLSVGACDGDAGSASTADTGTATTIDDVTAGSTADPPTTVPTPTTVPGSTDPTPTTVRESTDTATTGAPPSTAPDGAEALGPLGETDVAIVTDEGSIQIGSGTVPAVASAVPVPDDLEVELASESNGSAGFTGSSAESVEALAAFYRAELPAAGFEITDDQDVGPAVFIAFARDGEVGQIAISADPTGDGTTLIVAFGPA